MIPDKKTRGQLKTCIKNKLQISPNDKLQLFLHLEKHTSSILSVLKWLYEDEDERVHPNVLSLLSALSCNTPVCAIIHPEKDLLDTIQNLIDETSSVSARNNPSQMLLLQTRCPLLFNAIAVVNESPLPLQWKTLLKDMVDKAVAPFKIEAVSTMSPTPIPEENTTAYFPNLPLLRERARFAADTSTDKEQNCSKYSGGHPTLLPGIFTVFCHHGMFIPQANVSVETCYMAKNSS